MGMGFWRGKLAWTEMQVKYCQGVWRNDGCDWHIWYLDLDDALDIMCQHCILKSIGYLCFTYVSYGLVDLLQT